MKKFLLLGFMIFFIFTVLYLNLGKSEMKNTSKSFESLIPAETMSFSNIPLEKNYHCVKNVNDNFNIYNTPQDYNADEVDRRENVLVILDCSFSMDDEVGGKRKIDIARDVINDVLGQLPKNVNLGFRVYGHDEGGFLGINGCKATELLVPIGYKTQNAISAQLKNLDAIGWTPICYSLDKAINNDFPNINGQKRIILVSDGMDTCGGDPCDFAVKLMKKRSDVTIDVIGFDIASEPTAISQLKCVALSTHGKFYKANNSAEFMENLKNSLNVTKEVEGKIFSK